MPDAGQQRRTRPKLPPLTAEQKAQVLDLASQGMATVAISRHLGLHGSQVNGTVQNYRRTNAGALPPPDPVPPPGISENPEMAQIPPPEPSLQVTVQPHVPAAAPTRPVPLPASARDAGFSGGGRPVQVDSGGFTSSFSELRWTIERIQPQDGVLGTHYGPFTLEDLGQIYGAGTYRITKQEPGKIAMEYTRKIGDSYGPSRAPKMSSPSSAPGVVQRPGFRPWEGREPGDPSQMPFRRPFFPHGAMERPSGGGGDSGVATEAIRQMGQVQQKLMDQHKDTPDAKISEFLSAQADLQNRRFDEERRRDDDKRKDDEAKWERRQQEDRTRWEREQLASRDAHDREMLRIKVENDARLKELGLQAEEREKREQERQKFLLELDDKRLQLVRMESEAQQKRLESELNRTRDEMNKIQDRTNAELKETRESTQRALEQNQTELDERLDREREVLEREYKIREKGLEREHELNREILSIQKAQIENQTGDQLFNMIQTFVKEASKGLEKVCELKKLEAMTPEAQAAAAARGTIDGNVLNGPNRQAAAPPATEGEPQPTQPSAPKTPVDGPSGIESRVHAILEQPEGQALFKDIVQEWAQHVSVGNDPSIFATLYLEMLQNQKDSDTRLFCTILFTLMSARPWSKMHAFLKTYLTPEAEAIFSKPQAEEFYEAFRAMVHAQMKEYWVQLTKATQAKQPAAAPQAPHLVEVPVEPPGDGASPEAPVEPLVAVDSDEHEEPPAAS
jgi:DNA-binding CsgD family transcriptional regulator